MTTRLAIVTEARTWIDTPFHHQGRKKRVGVDCIGVPLCSARAAGIAITDGPIDYPRFPTPERSLALLREWMDEIPITSARMGNLLFVWFSQFADGAGGLEEEPSHFVLISENGRGIHAYNTIARVEDKGSEEKPKKKRKRRAVKAGRVVEAAIPTAWLKQTHSAWRFRGLAD